MFAPERGGNNWRDALKSPALDSPVGRGYAGIGWRRFEAP